MGVSTVLDSPALWGLMGALVFAAPRLTACIYNAAETKARYSRCVAEALVALLTGVIGAAAFEPWLAGLLHMAAPNDARALGTVIGIIANPTAPTITTLLSDIVLTRIKGGS